MRKILITGANGYLGGIVTKEIISNTDYGVLAIAELEEELLAMIDRMEIGQNPKVSIMTNSELFREDTKLEDVEGALHLAFARGNHHASDIASSLDFAKKVFCKLSDCQIPRVINMSSQGIYGNTKEYRSEETSPAPETNYTMAKYASELIFNDSMKKIAYHTNLRLDLVAQSQNVIRGLCRQAREGKINLRGGKQQFSFIDGNDVGRAIIAMLQRNEKWEEAYNVGWNQQRYTLIELANIIADVTKELGMPYPEIYLEEQDIHLCSGMNSSKFIEQTGWMPTRSLKMTVGEILKGEE